MKQFFSKRAIILCGFVLTLFFSVHLTGCRLINYDSDPSTDAAGAAELGLIEGSIPEAEEAVKVSAQMLQNEIVSVLAEYQSVLSPSVRFSVRQLQVPVNGFPDSLPVNLPDFTGKYLAITPNLGSVLSGITAPEGLEKITDINEFMQKYQLNLTALQPLVARAKGILVNLEQLSPATMKNHPLIQAGLAANLPVIFENPAILADFSSGWNSDTAASAVESMAAALGVGISAHISIVLPSIKDTTVSGAMRGSLLANINEEDEEPGKADYDIVSLGAQEEEVLDNGNEETAESDESPADGDFIAANDHEETEVPLEEEGSAFEDFAASQSANIRASSDGFANTNNLPQRPYTHISELAFKVVKTGSAPENTDRLYYRSFRVKPRGRQVWKSARAIKNNGLVMQQHYHRVEYKVQLTYALNGKRYLRIHTMKDLDTDPLQIDKDAARGYFQFAHRVKIYPVGRTTKKPYAIPGLSLIQTAPRFHKHTESLLKKLMNGEITVPSSLDSPPSGNEEWAPFVSITSLPCKDTALNRAIFFFHHGFKTKRFWNRDEGIKWYSRVCQAKWWNSSMIFKGWALNEAIVKDTKWVKAFFDPTPSIAILGAVHALVKKQDESFFNKIAYYAAKGTYVRVDSWKDFFKEFENRYDFVCAPPLAALSQQKLPYQAVWEMTNTGKQTFFLETQQTMRAVWRDWREDQYRDTTRWKKQRNIIVDFSSVGP